jgi:hypothetical protein
MSDIGRPGRGSSGITIAVITAVGALLAAVTGCQSAAPQSPSLTSRSSPSSTPSSSSTPSPPVFKIVAFSCTTPALVRRNQTVTVTYHIQVTGEADVGVGAGIFDAAGHDFSDGSGDQDSVQLYAGALDQPRRVHIPADLAPGTYKLTIELWPANSIGVGEFLKEASCGSITVTR